MELPSFVHAFLDAFPNASLYIVGGAVRDDLLGRPITDVDFVVCRLARADIERWFGERGRIDLTGARFGVYKFVPEGKTAADGVYDIALPRTEQAHPNTLGGYRDFDVQADASLPIEADLSRRDFTINAMALDVRDGTRVDIFNGNSDLNARLIRTVGEADERFGEDLSRVLRGIRFAVQLDFDMEPTTWESIKRHVPLLNRMRTREDGAEEFVVPRETIGKELAKALSADPVRAITLLHEARALPVVFGGYSPTSETLAPIAHTHPLTVVLALLFRNETPENVRRLCRESGLESLPSDGPLRVSADDVAWIVGHLASATDPNALLGSEFERVYMNERGEWFLQALEAIGKTEIAEAARARAKTIRTAWNVGVQEKVPALVSGTDALAAGIPEGPEVRLALDRIRNAQLDGAIRTREQALELLKTVR